MNDNRQLLTRLILTCLYFATFGAHAEIIFSAKIMGPVSNIYALNHQQQLIKLTNNDAWRDMEPAKSPQGDLVFLSNRRKNKTMDLHKQTEFYNLFLISAEKKQLHQLTDSKTAKYLPQFSPDGKWISYVARENDQEYIQLINKKTQKTSLLIRQQKIFDYSWSPDNKRLTYTGVSKGQSLISSIDLTSKTSSILFKPNNKEQKNSLIAADSQPEGKEVQVNYVSARWSPDGKYIAYIAANTATKQRRLYLLNPREKNSRLLSSEGVQVQAPISWSPQSNKVLYAGLTGYNFYWDEKNYQKVYQGEMNIYISALTGKTRKIETGKTLSNRPVFSPNEKSIAFLGGDSLSARDLTLFTMDTDGANLRANYTPVPGHSALQWY